MFLLMVCLFAKKMWRERERERERERMMMNYMFFIIEIMHLLVVVNIERVFLFNFDKLNI